MASVDEIRAHVANCESPSVGNLQYGARVFYVWTEWFQRLREMVGLERIEAMDKDKLP